jgi:hypothetical protein
VVLGERVTFARPRSAAQPRDLTAERYAYYVSRTSPLPRRKYARAFHVLNRAQPKSLLSSDDSAATGP